MTGRPDPLDAALLAAWNASEPEGPECHLCGSTAGPLLPDPVGDRWPTGAQELFCSRGCQGGGFAQAETLPAVPDLDAVEDAKGVHTMDTPGGPPLLGLYATEARQLLADIDAIDYTDQAAAARLLGRASVIVAALLRTAGEPR